MTNSFPRKKRQYTIMEETEFAMKLLKTIYRMFNQENVLQFTIDRIKILFLNEILSAIFIRKFLISFLILVTKAI